MPKKTELEFWSHEPKICKAFIFHELCVPKYDNFKITSTDNICLEQWKKKILQNVLGCFKLGCYTLSWKVIKTLHV